MKKLLPLLLLFFCFSCADDNSLPVSVEVNADSTIQIKGLPPDIINELSRDTITGIWDNLLPVYRMPADIELKNDQPQQPGSYTVVNDAIIFKPDTPFVKGETYFVRFYNYDKGGSSADLVKQDGMRPGSHPYSDLIFTR